MGSETNGHSTIEEKEVELTEREEWDWLILRAFFVLIGIALIIGFLTICNRTIEAGAGW